MVTAEARVYRAKDITAELCGWEFSHWAVSNLTEKSQAQVQSWAERPLETEYLFLLADAMRPDVRRWGAVRSIQALIVVSISEE